MPSEPQYEVRVFLRPEVAEYLDQRFPKKDSIPAFVQEAVDCYLLCTANRELRAPPGEWSQDATRCKTFSCREDFLHEIRKRLE